MRILKAFGITILVLLGAAVFVAIIAFIGYKFGNTGIAIILVMLLAAGIFWAAYDYLN